MIDCFFASFYKIRGNEQKLLLHLGIIYKMISTGSSNQSPLVVYKDTQRILRFLHKRKYKILYPELYLCCKIFNNKRMLYNFLRLQ